MFFSKFNRKKIAPTNKRVVEVGWVLQTDHAKFIWDAPRPVRHSEASPEHAKSVAYCPAVVDHEARLFEVPCPFDLRLRVELDEKQEARLIDVEGDNSGLIPRTLAQIAPISSRKQWRHPNRPIIQIKTPYTFLADEVVYINQMPPFLYYRDPSWPGVMIGGRIPIHIWPRPLSWAFEWYDMKKELVLTRGQPWFYCRFETPDPSRHVRLVEAEMTDDLKKYFAGINGVVNYVNGTFSLFSTAQQRRPERLVIKVQRQGRNKSATGNAG